MSVISVKDVSKSYYLYRNPLDKLKELASFGKRTYGREFRALQDVNLELEQGTILGIIGRNGSGKSTLLKVIAGVLEPSRGNVEVNGRLSALLELGTGFNPEFTGRENVIMNGQILGLSRKEIKELVPEIEKFAGIGEFIDQPVKTYSSGMRVRLGFSVALFVDPEILLVDEALTVGDAEFKHVGMNRVRELKTSGKTIVLVSHSASMIKSLCTEAILMDKGKILNRGAPAEIVDQYRSLISPKSGEGQIDEAEFEEYEDQDFTVESGSKDSGLKERHDLLRYGSGEAKIRGVEVLNADGESVEAVGYGEEMTVSVDLEYLGDVEKSTVQIIVRDRTGLDVIGASVSAGMNDMMKSRTAGERQIVNFKQRAYLRHGMYSIVATVMKKDSSKDSKKEPMDWVNVAKVFEVERAFPRRPVLGLVDLPTEIEVLEAPRAESPRESA